MMQNVVSMVLFNDSLFSGDQPRDGTQRCTELQSIKPKRAKSRKDNVLIRRVRKYMQLLKKGLNS
jgi:hypothetical protein